MFKCAYRKWISHPIGYNVNNRFAIEKIARSKMRDLVKYEEEYKKLPFEKYQIEYRRKKVIELIQLSHPQTVLEIGCGLFPLFESVREVEKWVVVEPTISFYENAMAQKGDNENVIIYQDCLENLVDTIENTRMKIDYIVCGCLLHELEKPENMLEAIWKIADDDTIIHVNVPNAKSIHRLLAKEMGLIDDIYQQSAVQIKMQQSNTIYNIDSLKNICKKQGFDIFESGSYFIKPFTHAQMQRCMDNDIFDETLLDGLYKLEKFLQGYGSEIYVQMKKGEK